MIVIVAVRIMTDGAALLESRLVHMLLLTLLGLFAVTTQANRNRVRLGERGRATRMGIVAVGAIARRARMRDFRLLDLFGLIGVAGHAQVLGAGLSQDDFAV